MKTKLFLILAISAMTVMPTMAQDNSWEMPENTGKNGKNAVDQKYLAGAVPEVNGKVVFEKTIAAPGKSKKQIFDIVSQQMEKMTKESNQFEQSRIVLCDTTNFSQVVGSYQEWLVFKNKPLVLDRTRLFFHLMADIKDGEVTFKLTRIHYLYDEERQATTYTAEEWINDKYGLNRKMTKLARVSGKFRRKTIDRKDYIFNKMEQLLNK